MNKFTWGITILTVCVGFVCSASAADVCISEQSNLIGKTFVAKEVLYDTKVAVEGIVKLEWDKEAVPKGGKFQIERILCSKNKMELTLRPISDRKMRKVKIYFLIKESSRSEPEGKEKLQKIMDYVFEPAGEDGE
jgi:hypothetical protein